MIYIFLANGFEEVEALATVDVLRRADLKVKIVGIGSDVITGAHGISTVCDAVDSDLTPGDDIEAVILPGGMPGTLNLERSAKVNAFVDYAYENQKIVCAICAAPSILGHKGMLKGKKAVCFPGFESELEGAELSDSFVVTDGNIITAKGMGSAVKFGIAIGAAFVGEAKMKKIEESLQCSREIYEKKRRISEASAGFCARSSPQRRRKALTRVSSTA